MSALLLLCFLLACVMGAIAAWRWPVEDIKSRAVPLFLLVLAVIAGTLMVAAEVGSPVARYLGLIAVLLASASFCGGLIATGRDEKAKQAAERP